MLRWLSAVLFIWVVHASENNLASVLAAQPSLTKFTSLINGYPDILAAAQVGSMTVIAPNDDAFDTFFASPGPAGNYSTSDELHALLQYHILNGAHASFSITSTPTFIPTILKNSSYTNVTTGQVVEAVTNQSTITFQSAVHEVSKVVGSEFDIIFLGGYIHIVDAVLVPPLDALTTVAEYPLTYFIETLSFVLNSNYTQTLLNITDLPDRTYFAANDEAAAAASQNDTLSKTEDFILNQTEYITIPGQVVYSTELTNGSKWLNGLGVNLTITEINGDKYVNDAKIIATNLLIANGVIHVIDKNLNWSDPNAIPQINNNTGASNSSTSGSNTSTGTNGGLSTGAKAGIGIGVAIAVLALIGIAIFLLRKRRSHNTKGKNDVKSVSEIGHHPVVHEKDHRSLPHEMITKSYDAAELDARSRAQELDGATKPHMDTSTTEGSSISHTTEDVRR